VPPPVELVGVTKRFGTFAAVDDLSFRLEPGTITGFLGPNGAGKTTTLRMIGGLVRPTDGTVRVFGIDAAQPQSRQRLGYMPADPAFLPRLSGLENLDLLLRVRGAGRSAPLRERAAEALTLTGRDLCRPVGDSSSGMRQKLAIVAAMQHAPDLVLLDEPANRLDPLAHRAFCELLRSLAAERRSVLLSSHVLAEVEEACDGVVLVRAGRLLREASVDALRRQASRAVTLVFSSPPEHAPAVLTGARIDGAQVTGRIPARRPELVRQLAAVPGVVDITVAPASLEDVFLDLYAGGGSRSRSSAQTCGADGAASPR
jgi:ABC-2 type transport system ATP-binding protein